MKTYEYSEKLIQLYEPGNPFFSFDMIFLDSQSNTKEQFLDLIPGAEKASFIIVDDTQNPRFSVPVQEWLAKHNRFNTYNIDLVGREDRHQLVNCIDPTFHFTNWVWNWRPDRKYW